MKYLVLILVVTMTACAPLVTAGIGGATALSIEANYPKVDKKAEEIFKAE